MGLNNLGLGFLFTAKDLASGVMNKVTNSFNRVEGASDEFKAATQSAFKQFGVGAAIMGVGLAGLAALGPAITESREFSKAIALVATEADLAVFPQEKMREVAEGLAVQYGKAPVDQAKALYKAVALGANDAAKSLDFLNGVNLLAVAGNADLETTANALGGALNAYGASFDHATEYSDAFFTAMKNGNTTVQDLASAVGRVTSSAANMNIPIQEILGAVSVMTNKGVAAAEAVSGLKEALANVVHPSAAATAEASRLGIKFDQATLRAKGLQGFLQMITGSAKFNAESFSKLFTSVEGSNAVIQVASGNMGAFNAVMEEMKNSTGATQKGFDIMSQTLDFQAQRFEANKKVALGLIGQVLEPMGAGLARAANAILEGFTKLPKPVIAFLVKLWAGVSAVLAFVGAALAVKAAIALFAIGMKAIGVTIGGVIAALWPIILAVGVLTAVMYGFKQAYEQNIGGFGDFVRNAYAKVKLAFDAIVQLFTQGGFSGAVMDELNKAENAGVKNFAIKVFLWVERIRNFFANVATGFAAGIEAAKPAFEAFVGALEHLGETLGFISKKGTADENLASWERWGRVGAVVGKVIAGVVEFIVTTLAIAIEVTADLIEAWGAVKDGAVAAWEGIKGAWNAVGAFFSAVGSAIAGAFRAAVGAVVSVFTSVYMTIVGIFTAIGSAVSAAVSAVVDVVMRVVTIFRLVGEIIGIVLGAIASKVGAAVMNFLAPYIAAVKSAFNRVVAFVTEVFEQVVSFVSDVFAGMVAIAVGVAVAVAAPFIAAWVVISGFVGEKMDEISALWSEAVSFFVAKGGEVADGARSIFDSVVDSVMTVVDAITGALSDAWDTMKSIAMPVLDAISSAIEAIANGLAKVGSFVSGVASGIATGVSSAYHGALGSLGVDADVTQRVQQIGTVASGGPMAPPPPSGAPLAASAAGGAPTTDLSQTNALLSQMAQAGQKPPVINIRVDKDGNVTQDPGGFSPAAPPTN